jgi:hypothetical protein
VAGLALFIWLAPFPKIQRLVTSSYHNQLMRNKTLRLQNLGLCSNETAPRPGRSVDRQEQMPEVVKW